MSSGACSFTYNSSGHLLTKKTVSNIWTHFEANLCGLVEADLFKFFLFCTQFCAVVDIISMNMLIIC